MYSGVGLHCHHEYIFGRLLSIVSLLPGMAVSTIYFTSSTWTLMLPYFFANVLFVCFCFRDGTHHLALLRQALTLLNLIPDPLANIFMFRLFCFSKLMGIVVIISWICLLIKLSTALYRLVSYLAFYYADFKTYCWYRSWFWVDQNTTFLSYILCFLYLGSLGCSLLLSDFWFIWKSPLDIIALFRVRKSYFGDILVWNREPNYIMNTFRREILVKNIRKENFA